MENITSRESFNKRLSDEQLTKLLPALSLLAEDVDERIPLNRNSLSAILVSVGLDKEEWAFEELGIWSRALEKARDSSGISQNDTLLAELKSRGIPDFPGMLSIYVATSKQKKTESADVTHRPVLKRPSHTDKPVEPYHRLLPDHGWHNDLTWAQLPDWIKKDAKLVARLRRGEHVNGKRVIYKTVANKLIRRLRYRVPVA